MRSEKDERKEREPRGSGLRGKSMCIRGRSGREGMWEERGKRN